MEEQLRMDDVNPEYQAFVDKFKPKLTTDDCYTPDDVYNAIRDMVVDCYGLEGVRVVRPFWPGGDYQREDYTDCVVIDNPPFSIISKVVLWYMDRGIRFFLFAPHLTLFSAGSGDKRMTRIVTSAEIVYANGAKVNTDFLTNLEPGTFARTWPQLTQAIAQAQKSRPKVQLPKYKYDHVLTSATMGIMAQHGISMTIPADECCFVRSVASQKAAGKAIFGAGILVSDSVWRQADEARKIVWALSPEEAAIVQRLSQPRSEAQP